MSEFLVSKMSDDMLLTAKQPGFLPRYGVTYFIIQQAAAIGGFVGGFVAMRSAPAKRFYARTKLATVEASMI